MNLWISGESMPGEQVYKVHIVGQNANTERGVESIFKLILTFMPICIIIQTWHS